MPDELLLRDISPDDLPILFEHQLDPEANHMAAFVSTNPADRAAFDAHWAKILADESIIKQAIVVDGAVAGNLGCFDWEGKRSIGYWLGREYWGRGLATRALAAFLGLVAERPLHAQVAKDNLGSLRVLEKCGFAISGEGTGFANARGAEIEEWHLTLA